jgi:S-adenosylmethionine-diacylglycerol 3-amino-3-carboxypropyl transferase
MPVGNQRLKRAVHRESLKSKRGVLDRLFVWSFSGLVYPQIWEDPALDMEALDLKPGARIATIASGGCNVLSYLAAEPARIAAVDLNPAHVALTRLKLAAARHLPDYEAFFRFFGYADEKRNVRAYDRFIRPHLDRETRKYWEARRTVTGRRINYFARNVYRFGLLGRFIGVVHLLARLYGRNPRQMLTAKSLEEQRQLFETLFAPLFDVPLVQKALKLPVSLYGLGIPPAQYELLAASGGNDMALVLRQRLERLACGFPLQDNYFAWQAFGRGYDRDGRQAVPPYLRSEAFETIRAGTGAVEVRLAAMTEFLADQPAGSFDGFVLLDAQDWMGREQIVDLWDEITRTAHAGARVVFRTAGEESPLEAMLPPEIRERWHYDAAACQALVAKDRASIYGGFHLYVLRS